MNCTTNAQKDPCPSLRHSCTSHVFAHCRFCGERMDIWVLRFAEHAPLKYHGLEEVAHCRTEEALGMAKSIWFLDGMGEQRQKAVEAIMERWPLLLMRCTAQIAQQRMTALFGQLVGPGNPSSGWQGRMFLQFGGALYLCRNALLPHGNHVCLAPSVILQQAEAGIDNCNNNWLNFKYKHVARCYYRHDACPGMRLSADAHPLVRFQLVAAALGPT